MSRPTINKRKAPGSAKVVVPRKKTSLKVANVEVDQVQDESGSELDADADMGIYNDPMIDAPYSGSDDDRDEDEQDGSVDEDEGEDIPSAFPPEPVSIPTPNKGKGKSLYAPPTLEELDRLNPQTSTSTFNLQLNALLESTIISSSASSNTPLKGLLKSLHSHIMSLPSIAVIPPKKALARLKKAGGEIPYVISGEYGIKGDEKWGLGWEMPEEVFVGGSWSVVGGYKKGKGESGGVDMVVVMPKGLSTPKDRLDYRYFHKRSYYLAIIASSLKKAADSEDSPFKGAEISFGCDGGDARRATIQLAVGKEQGLKHKSIITISLASPPNLFPASSLNPTKCNLRHSSSSTSDASPIYDTSLSHDSLAKTNLLALHRLSQTLPENDLAKFLALWRIWGSKRGISRERGGSGHLGGVLLGWVVFGGWEGVRVEDGLGKVRKGGGLGKSLGAWGSLRGVWEFLAHTDFEKNPVFLGNPGDSAIPHVDFVKGFKDVLVDQTGSVNVFGGWQKGDIDLLRYYARETLAMLEDGPVDRFTEVFLRDYTLGPAGYDEYIEIDVANAISSSDLLQQADHPTSDHLLVHNIARKLRLALTDRITLLHVRPPSDSRQSIQIRINLSPTNGTRVLDIGPSSSSSNTAAVAAFRELWGSKAELRRFKDGSITESVIWDIKRPEEASAIPSRIIAYILQLHFAIPETSVRRITSDSTWLQLTQIPDTAREMIHTPGSEKLGFRPINEVYDSLYKLLKNLDSELPLSILDISPSSPLLRHASTFIPHPIDIPRQSHIPDNLRYIPSANVILQFESSPRWPDDLAAVQKVKLALMCKLAEEIKRGLKGSKTSVVFDQGAQEIEDGSALEVLLPSGFAFNLRIYYPKERLLLERALEPIPPSLAGTSLPQPPRRYVIPALKTHLYRYEYATQHHKSLAPLHHRYPSFSAALRLFKRWFAAHMLSVQIKEEVVELLMVAVYLDTGSLGVPASAVSGFLRGVKLLSEWDWREGGLFIPIVGFGAGLSEQGGARVRFDVEKRKIAEGEFERLRKLGKGGWCLFTEEDLSGIRWTEGVEGVVAGRVRGLARGMMDGLKGALEEALDVRALFTTPLEGYDVLLHLNHAVLSRYVQGVHPDHTEWEGKAGYRNVPGGTTFGEEVRVGFDPVESFVRDVQGLFGDSLLVFYDIHGGQVVGIVFNPARDAGRGLRPFLGYSSKPAESAGALITIDKAGILGEITRLGKGLITSVDKRS